MYPAILKKVVTAIIIISLLLTINTLAFAYEHSETGTSSSAHNWVLTEVALDESLQYLIDLDDPTEKNYVDVAEMIEHMESKEDKNKYKNYRYSARISHDGQEMMVTRFQDEGDDCTFQLYDMVSGKKIKEFKKIFDIHSFIKFSPDLKSYIYQVNKKLYIGNTQTAQMHRFNAGKNKLKTDTLEYGAFSPDGTQYAYTDGNKGIVILDVGAKPKVARLFSNLKINRIYEWDQASQAMIGMEESSGSISISLLNLQNGKRQYVRSDLEGALLSLDHERILFTNMDMVKMFTFDIQSKKKVDITETMLRSENWTIPIQWISSDLNYRKYGNSR